MVAGITGLALGAGLGRLAGGLVRSDNLPFFIALGAVAGICLGVLTGLIWLKAPHSEPIDPRHDSPPRWYTTRYRATVWRTSSDDALARREGYHGENS